VQAKVEKREARLKMFALKYKYGAQERSRPSGNTGLQSRATGFDAERRDPDLHRAVMFQ
jgi:hypothetical protein